MEEKIVNKECKIEKQEAETIYNINGNLKIYNENRGLDNKNLLKKYSALDYGFFLEKSYSEKKVIIRTRVLLEIQRILENTQILLLYGDPGVGKSFLVSEIKKNYETIYISIKAKSEKEICLYLLSKLLIEEEIESKELISIEDIRSELEINLINNKKLFIFDDIEKNPKILEVITSLELFENKILFISRIKNLKSNRQFLEYELKGFTTEEAKEFLKINNVKLTNNMEMDKLIEISQRNPLYLYYYSHYQITPLPEGLKNFQIALWNEMTSFQKEILSFISLPLFELSFKDIKKCIEITNSKSMNLFDFQNELDKLSHLLVKNNGCYSVFHSSLSEYILEILNELEIVDEYKKILANIKIENKNFLEAVYLLLDIPKSKLKEIIFFPINEIRELGLLSFGVKVLKKAIQLHTTETNDDIRARGFAYHYLTLFYNDLYMLDESIQANNYSIECFEKINDVEALLNAKLFKAIDLLKENKRQEAKILVEEIKEKIPEEGYLKASLCINLSKFYIDLNNYMEAKKYAEISYIEFQKEQQEIIKLNGIKQSLNNLAIAYSLLDGKENLEKSIEYGKLLYEISMKTNDIRTRVSISNLLTRSYKELNDYENAHKFCDEAINLSKTMKSIVLIVKNIINKGNVYKKEEKNNKALECYIEAKQYSIENSILEEEVRVLKLITDIYFESKDYKEGKIIAEEFLEKSKKLGIYYRINEAYYILGRISYHLNEEKWKIYLFESLKVLYREKEYEEAINDTFNIINTFKESLQQFDIISYIKLLIENEAYKVNLEKVLFFIATNDLINFSQKIDILKLIIEKPNIEKILTKDILINFIEVIQLKNKEILPDKIMELIEVFLKNKTLKEFMAYLLISIICFSKSFDKESQDKLLEKFSNILEQVYYRETSTNEFILTICSKKLKLQIIGEKTKLVTLNLAIIIGLLIKNNITEIVRELNILNERYYTIIIENYSNTLKYKLQENREIIKDINQKSKNYILGVDKEKNIWIFIKDNFQEDIYLLKEGEKLGLLDTLFDLFILMYKIEKTKLEDNVEEKIVELLISIFLPKIKVKKERVAEELNILQIKNDITNVLEKLY